MPDEVALRASVTGFNGRLSRRGSHAVSRGEAARRSGHRGAAVGGVGSQRRGNHVSGAHRHLRGVSLHAARERVESDGHEHQGAEDRQPPLGGFRPGLR